MESQIKRNREVAIAQLLGQRPGMVARHHNISSTECRRVLRRYCWRLEPDLYSSLREDPYLPVPIRSIISKAEIFLKIESDDSPITKDSKIWRIPELSTRVIAAMHFMGVTTIEDFMNIEKITLKRVPNLGEISMQEIKQALFKHGIIWNVWNS